MCKRAQCPTCHRPTYAGCGRHVEQVLGDVPPAERCQGHPEPAKGASTGTGRSRIGRSWFGRRAPAVER